MLTRLSACPYYWTSVSTCFVYCMFFLNCLVAKEIDVGVIQLIIERTAVTLETMSHDSHVTYWGCKVFAHAGKNSKWIIIS